MADGREFKFTPDQRQLKTRESGEAGHYIQEGPYASRFTEPIRRRHRRAVPPLGCDDRAGVFAAPPHDERPAEAVGRHAAHG